SDDGRFVGFELTSWDTPFVGFRPQAVYLRDMRNAVAKSVSANSAGMAANADALDSSISRDGRFVTFTSAATNLVPQPLGASTVFLHENPGASPPAARQALPR